MSVKENPEYAGILAAMQGLAADSLKAWVGVIYRSAPPRWAASQDMLSGHGSKRSGARYNAAGSFSAIYGSTTPELAMAESLAFQRRAGLPLEEAMPLVFKAVHVSVERMLDLTDAQVLMRLSLSRDQIKNEQWWVARARGEESVTQAIGRAAHACGVQAILVSSAHTRDPAWNVILLPDHIAPPSELKVVRGRARK